MFAVSLLKMMIIYIWSMFSMTCECTSKKICCRCFYIMYSGCFMSFKKQYRFNNCSFLHGGDKLSGLTIQMLDCTTSTGKCFGAVRSRGFFGQICRRTYLSAPVLIKTVVFQTIFSKIVNSLIYEVSTLEDTYFHSSIFTAFILGFEA